MTIRFRLTIWFVVVILLTNSLLTLITARQVGNVLIGEVQTRVRLDLNSARRVYRDHLNEIVHTLRTLYPRQGAEGDWTGAARASLDSAFGDRAGRTPLDILTLLDPSGRVVHRAHNPGERGDDLSGNPVVAEAMGRGEAVTGTILASREQLLREGESLAQRAYFDLIDTPAARATEKKVETGGMLIAAAIPVDWPLPGGESFTGFLYGARMLNRSYEIVDTIKEEVFQNQTYEGKDIGQATIFMGDLRVSTNVPTAEGRRAIGTRLSEEVYNRVLVEGGIWADKAFVVNDWYITAYEPIRDPAGNIVGALYVGLLEEPYKHSYSVIVVAFIIVVSLTSVISLFLLDWITKIILKPIGSIVDMAKQVIDGNLTARVAISPPGEMGILCKEINQMAEAVQQREEKLKLTTRKQIGQSEKLASIGRLAAGIAHEINNPLTGVLTFAHLLKQKENMSGEDRQDLDVIINETTRVRDIVRGLLDFARESPSTREPLDLNHLIRQTNKLIRGQKEYRGINFVENFQEPLPRIAGDKNQLQQVFLNIILNACQAMRESGTLEITTGTRDNEAVELKFRDTGCGIPGEQIKQIFDPFYTTKPVGKGTGLGLSVSYGIIESHRGTIDVESEVGEGTAFTITLPLNSSGPVDVERDGRGATR